MYFSFSPRARVFAQRVWVCELPWNESEFFEGGVWKAWLRFYSGNFGCSQDFFFFFCGMRVLWVCEKCLDYSLYANFNNGFLLVYVECDTSTFNEN